MVSFSLKLGAILLHPRVLVTSYFLNQSRVLVRCSLGSREYAWLVVRTGQELSGNQQAGGNDFLTSIPLVPPQIQFYQTQEL